MTANAIQPAEPYRNHYCPKGHMRQWRHDPQQEVVRCVRWVGRRGKIVDKPKGLDAIGKIEHLLSRRMALAYSGELEGFFQPIEDGGYEARDCLLEQGVETLDDSMKIKFATYMMSLFAREPSNVLRHRDVCFETIQEISNNADTRIQLALLGTSESLETIYANYTGGRLAVEDAFCESLKTASTLPIPLRALSGAFWIIRQSLPGDEPFVLSDVPLLKSG